MVNSSDFNGLEDLVHVPTGYKILDNPTSIELILTNC